MICQSPFKPRRAAALAVLAAITAVSPASAQNRRDRDNAPVDHGTLSGPPVMAIVSIKNQRISLYDGTGAAMRARVSSGKYDYETPVGIYSVLQKQEEHYSNVYDDASMPFMQRITWSGVALHEGQLPGYPASHGCVRMPRTFAEQIFPLTKIGMRVIVAHDDVAPVDFTHPNLLKPVPMSGTAVATATAFTTGQPGNSVYQPIINDWPQRQTELDALKAIAATKSIEAERTKGPAEELKSVLTGKTQLRDKLAKALRAIEKTKKSADEKSAKAERALVAERDPAKLKKWEEAKAKADAALIDATAKVADVSAQWRATTEGRARTKVEKALRAAERSETIAASRVKSAERDLAAAQAPLRLKKWEDDKAKADAAAATVDEKYNAAKAAWQTAEDDFQQAKKQSDEAQAVMTAALDVAREAMRKTLPVSIFVSLKAQRLYVRQGHEPVMDLPVTITDPSRPIGTHIFTAVDYAAGGNDLRWNAVALGRRSSEEVAELSDRSSRRDDSRSAPFATNPLLASAALDRVAIPPEVLERVSASVWPGSSIIVSDEPLSKETGNSTDFVVVMSGYPQGGIKRRPKPAPQPMFSNRYYSGYGYGERPYYGGRQYYGGRPYVTYDRYGRPMQVRPRPKPLFNWW